MADEVKSYRLTEAAGTFVAGRRVPTVPGKRTVKGEDGQESEVTTHVPDPDYRLQLTERQARYELLNGTIGPDEPEPEAAPAAVASAEPEAPAGTARGRKAAGGAA